MRADRDEAHLLQHVIDSAIKADQLAFQHDCLCGLVQDATEPATAALVGKELEGVDATAVAHPDSIDLFSWRHVPDEGPFAHFAVAWHPLATHSHLNGRDDLESLEGNGDPPEPHADLVHAQFAAVHADQLQRVVKVLAVVPPAEPLRIG